MSDIITLKEAAHALRQHPRTTRRKMQRGEVPGYLDLSPGAQRGRWLTTRQAIEAHIDQKMALRPGVTRFLP